MHITYDDLHHYSRGAFGRFRAFVIENHLCGCALCSARLGEVFRLVFAAPAITSPALPLPQPAPEDRRREPRVPTDDAAQLQVIAPFSVDRIPVRVLDVSKSGMQLRLEAPLDPGSTVKVRLREAILFAEIRHCRQTSEKDYRAGLQLQDVVSGHEIVRPAAEGD